MKLSIGSPIWYTTVRLHRGTASPFTQTVITGETSRLWLAPILHEERKINKKTLRVQDGVCDIYTDPQIVEDMTYVINYRGRLAAIVLGCDAHMLRKIAALLGV